jgi:DNA-binding NarL/FixJ family response regulator
MPIRAFEDDWLTGFGQREPVASVLLADHDPISRRVLGTVFRDAAHLEYLRCVDSHRPVEEWPGLGRADVVVLVVGAHEDATTTVSRLTAYGPRTLLVGTAWTRETLAAAFAAGATGCLIKDTEIGRVATAARAVASGHIVLSPQLLGQCLERTSPPGGVSLGMDEPVPLDTLLATLTRREREVLDLLADGRSTAETAEALALSAATVKSHVSHALAKLGVRNRLEAVLLMQRVRPLS